MAQTHTPGPWRAETLNPYQGLIVSDETGDNIAVAYDQKNAPLIAAAPDMLAALKALHACHRAFSGSEDWGMLDDEARAAAEQAIAKAEGK